MRVQVFGNIDHFRDDFLLFRTEQENPVDLDRIQRILGHHRQRGITAAEVIHGNGKALFPRFCQNIDQEIVVDQVNKSRFRDFEFKLMPGNPIFVGNLDQPVNELRAGKMLS